MEGNITSRGIGNWYLQETIAAEGFLDRDDLRSHVAGATAVAALNVVGLGLIAIDGPLPFADALGVAVLAIPDPIVYAVAYNIFD